MRHSRGDAIMDSWRPAKKFSTSSQHLYLTCLLLMETSHSHALSLLLASFGCRFRKGNIKYILSGEGAGTIFVIDDKTGNIHATKTLDREEQAQYTLTAQAVARDTKQTPGASLRVHCQGAGHQRQSTRVPSWPLLCASVWDVQCWWVWASGKAYLSASSLSLCAHAWQLVPYALFKRAEIWLSESESVLLLQLLFCDCWLVSVCVRVCLHLLVCMCLCLLHFHYAIHHQ